MAWRAEPWKNGRGITHVVARWPDTDDYDVRVSVAEVTEPGPFSTFPGYERWTVRLAPARLGLYDGGIIYWVPDREPLQLAGDVALVAELPDGPTRVLNVLARPGAIELGVGAQRAVDFAFDLRAGTERVYPTADGNSVDGELWVRSRRPVHR